MFKNLKFRKGVAALVTVLSLGSLIFIVSLATTVLAFWAIKNIDATQKSLKAYYAAYSENIGWISFNCKTGGANKTDICDTSDYRVQDLRSRTTAIKIDIAIQYNSEKPELSATSTNSFVFNLITPTR